MAAEELASSMIFTRCLIQDQLGLVLVDGARERNLISLRIVSKLKLPLQPHPAPYVVQSPYEDKFNMVVSQVAVTFSIGHYEDQVLCDVVLNLPSSLVLGQPWFRDRQVCFTSRRSKRFRIQSRNKVFVVNPLAPEAAAEDLKELHRLQEEYQKAILVKPWLGKVDQAKTQPEQDNPCFSLQKQSIEANNSADDEEAKQSHNSSRNASVDVDGGIGARGEAPEPAIDARINPETRAAELPNSPPTKQSRRETQLVGALGATSSSANAAETFNPTPGISGVVSLEPNIPVIVDSIRAKPFLFVKNTADEDPLLGGSNQVDSIKLADGEPSRDVRGSCTINQFIAMRSDSQTPNLTLSLLGSENLNSDDGGEISGHDSPRLRCIPCIESIEECNSLIKKADSCPGLKDEAVNQKAPIWRSSSRRCVLPESGNKENRSLGVIVPTESMKGAKWSPKKMQELEFRQKEVAARVEEAAKVFQKLEFELPSFDPIYEQFCADFDKRKDQALRAKLFEEGEPDMIPNFPPFTSQLLDKKLSKLGRRKAEFG
ncbi:unnamed protein product [Linum trigynum]|uniref:Uncharacterized protein n=1 Tax=Linum trigynum TaxID=586398 RepID=A0AAV2FWC8_9ROSI